MPPLRHLLAVTALTASVATAAPQGRRARQRTQQPARHRVRAERPAVRDRGWARRQRPLRAARRRPARLLRRDRRADPHRPPRHRSAGAGHRRIAFIGCRRWLRVDRSAQHLVLRHRQRPARDGPRRRSRGPQRARSEGRPVRQRATGQRGRRVEADRRRRRVRGRPQPGSGRCRQQSVRRGRAAGTCSRRRCGRECVVRDHCERLDADARNFPGARGTGAAVPRASARRDDPDAGGADLGGRRPGRLALRRPAHRLSVPGRRSQRLPRPAPRRHAAGRRERLHQHRQTRVRCARHALRAADRQRLRRPRRPAAAAARAADPCQCERHPDHDLRALSRRSTQRSDRPMLDRCTPSLALRFGAFDRSSRPPPSPPRCAPHPRRRSPRPTPSGTRCRTARSCCSGMPMRRAAATRRA